MTQRSIRRRRFAPIGVLVVLAVVAAIGLMWASSHRSAPQQQPLTLATGLPGGVYYEVGHALEQLTQESEVPLLARESAASQVNLELITAGEVDLGFSTSDVASLAATGQPPFDRELPVRAVGRMYDQPIHLVVRAESDYQQLSDLRGTTIATGAEGAGTKLSAERILQVAELDPRTDLQAVSMDLIESVEALESGQIEAFFWSGGLPSQAVTELAERTPIRLIDLSEWAEPLAEQGSGAYEDVAVPVDTYPGVPGVRTIGVSTLLMVHQDLSEETVAALTAEVFSSRTHLVQVHPVIRQLNERAAISTQPVELHPGALDYYHQAKPAHRRAQRTP